MYDKKKFVMDYMEESSIRIELANYAMDKKRYNTVIRECQAATELVLKALLFSKGRVVPAKHNLKSELKDIKDLFSDEFKSKFDFIYKISSRLRRERDIAMYGDVDLNKTATESFTKFDAEKYLNDTAQIFEICKKELKKFLN